MMNVKLNIPKYLLALFCLCIASVANLHAQDTEEELAKLLDSAKILLQQDPLQAMQYAHKADSLAREAFDTLSRAQALKTCGSACLFAGLPDSALNFYREASAVFHLAGNHKGASQCDNNIGLVYRQMSQYDSALIYMKKAMQYHKSVDNYKDYASSLGNIATVYHYLGNLEQAVAFYNQALEVLDVLKDTVLIVNNLSNLAVIYEDHLDHENALRMYHKALPLAMKYEYYESVSVIMQNISVVYHNLGQLDSAEHYLTQSLLIREERNFDISRVLWNLGTLKAEMEDYDKAIAYFFQALKMNRENGNLYQVAKGYRHIGKLLMKQQDYQSALEYFEQGYAIAREIKALDEMRICARELSMAASSLEDFEKANHYFDVFVKLSDSVFLEEETQQVQKQIADELTKDQKQILPKDLWMVFLNVFLFVLLFVLAIILVRRMVQKRNKSEK